MSRAFAKDEGPEDPIVVPPRAPLPPGVTNYVTARGLALLRTEGEELEREQTRLEAEEPSDEMRRALAIINERIVALNERLGSARLVELPKQAHDVVRFGATVTVKTVRAEDWEREGELRTFTIVGVDEADPEKELVAFIAPIARAVMTHRVGESVTLRAGRGEETLEIVEIRYE